MVFLVRIIGEPPLCDSKRVGTLSYHTRDYAKEYSVQAFFTASKYIYSQSKKPCEGHMHVAGAAAVAVGVVVVVV